MISRIKTGETTISQKYSNKHKAVDICSSKLEENNNVLAHSDGVVVSLVKNYNKTDKTGSSYGNYIKIRHSNGYYTLYAHLKYGSIKLNIGDYVKEGEQIAIIGNTGHSTGPHLHWELRDTKDKKINPTKYLTSDLPNMKDKKLYQVYDLKKNKWLSNVEVGKNDYAGNKGHNIGALYIDDYTYRVHDKIKNKWLPWVNGRNDYAGNMKPIDGVQIKNTTYRVYDNVKKKWLPWVNGEKDFAGNIGNSIGGVQIK